jgi:hypothetical protein
MPNPKWTPSQEQFIRRNYEIMSDDDMVTHFNKVGGRHITKLAVKRKRQRMGLEKDMGRPKGSKNKDREKPNQI